MEIKGVELGGFFNFIRNQPADSEHTKVKKLWINRFNYGMCPHCGQKLYKVKRIRLKRAFIPLNITGKVDNGVCTHPKCDPPTKVTPNPPGEGNTDDDDATVSHDDDSILDAIQEHRNDMAKFYQMMKHSNQRARDTAALMLEDTVMQLNRSMSEMSIREKEELRKVREDLLGEIDVAQSALKSLQGRVDYIEQVTSTLKRQVANLMADMQKGQSSIHREVEALRACLDEVRSGSDRSNDSLRMKVGDLSTRCASWELENELLRKENTALQASLEDSRRQRDSLSAQIVALQARLDVSSACQASPKPSVANLEPPSLMNSGPKAQKENFHSIPRHGKFKCHQTLTTHSDAVVCCAVIDHGRKLVSSSNNTLIVWKHQSGDGAYTCQQQLRRHSDRINCCAVARDQTQTLVSGSDDSTLIVWNQMRNGEYEYKETLRGHSDSVYCCGITMAGSTLVSGSKDNSFIVWRCQMFGEYQKSQILDGHSHSVECCALTADGRTLITGSADETLKVWQLQHDKNYEHKQSLEKHKDSVLCCTIDDSGMTIVSGSKDNSLLVWTRQMDGNYKYQQTLEEHSEWINCCVLLNDGDKMVSGSDDNTIRVWLRRPEGDYKCQQVLKKHANYVYCCAAIDGGQMFVSGGNDNTLKLWTLTNG